MKSILPDYDIDTIIDNIQNQIYDLDIHESQIYSVIVTTTKIDAYQKTISSDRMNLGLNNAIGCFIRNIKYVLKSFVDHIACIRKESKFDKEIIEFLTSPELCISYNIDTVFDLNSNSNSNTSYTNSFKIDIVLKTCYADFDEIHEIKFILIPDNVIAFDKDDNKLFYK